MHSEKINEAGEMYITTSGGITCYDLFTFAGKYRGGKIYNADKKYIILSGKCELITTSLPLDKGESEGVKKQKDEIEIISPKNGIFEIKSGTPHIFYFPEDTRMIEWFQEGTQSEDYNRYREMKKII